MPVLPERSMAAVISRVTTPAKGEGQGKTEYLATSPDVAPMGWTDKTEEAFVFKTHSLADQVATQIRPAIKEILDDHGQPKYWFIHARTIEDYEWDRFVGIGPKPRRSEDRGQRTEDRGSKASSFTGRQDAVPPKRKDDEFAVRLDPRRLGEIRRDPADVCEHQEE